MHGPDLPPLGALRAFEAAARLASFKAAAAELFVTPTAISHQIRQLEEQLGVTVLLRSSRAVSLTAEGKLLFDAVASGFADIRRAVAQLRAGTAPQFSLCPPLPVFSANGWCRDCRGFRNCCRTWICACTLPIRRSN